MPKKQHHPRRKAETAKVKCNVYSLLILALTSKERFMRLLLLVGVCTVCLLVIISVLGVVVVQVPTCLHGLVSFDFSLFGEHPD